MTLRLFIFILLYGMGQQCEKIYLDGQACYSILCKKGEEPVPCSAGDPHSATCRPCPAGTYSDGPMRLREKCNIKTFCVDDHMTVEDEGSATSDRVCGCEEGYRMSYYVHKCYAAPKTILVTRSTTTEEHSTSQHPEGADAAPVLADNGDKAEKSNPTTTIVIGSVAGGGVFILLVIILVVYLCKRRVSSSTPNKAYDPVNT